MGQLSPATVKSRTRERGRRQGEGERGEEREGRGRERRHFIIVAKAGTRKRDKIAAEWEEEEEGGEEEVSKQTLTLSGHEWRIELFRDTCRQQQRDESHAADGQLIAKRHAMCYCIMT